MPPVIINHIKLFQAPFKLCRPLLVEVDMGDTHHLLTMQIHLSRIFKSHIHSTNYAGPFSGTFKNRHL